MICLPPPVFIDDAAAADGDVAANNDVDDDEEADAEVAFLNDSNNINSNNMDDRASIYLDTISLASDFPGVAGSRKSISMSRQTIYHSAEDLGQQPPSTTTTKTPAAAAPAATGVGDFLTQLRRDNIAVGETTQPQRLNGVASNSNRKRNGGLKATVSGNSGFDTIDAADSIIAATAGHVPNQQQQQTTMQNDEVSAQTLLSSSNKTVTYTEWKKRVNSHGTELFRLNLLIVCVAWYCAAHLFL